MIMAADEAALVLVFPDDDMLSIVQKVRNAGSSDVELLVPDGVSTLQIPANYDALLDMLGADEISLLIISSDEQTLEAARQRQLETVGVKDARVTLPSMHPPDNGEAAQAQELPPAMPTPGRPTARAGASDSDMEFLRTLYAMPVPQKTEPPAQPPAEPAAPSSADEDFAAGLDDFSDMMNAYQDEQSPGAAEPPASRQGDQQQDRDDAFAADMDDLSAAFENDADTRRPAEPVPPADAGAVPPPRPRIRPEDIELSSEEKTRANRVRGASTTHERRRPQPAPAPRREPRERTTFMDVDTPEEEAVPQSKRSWLLPVLVAVLVLLLLVAAFVLFRGTIMGALPFGSSVTVTVQLPQPPSEPQPIVDQPIPLSQVGAASSALAVEAEEIRAAVAYTETGQVAEGVLTPSGTARGTVTIFNNTPQQIVLPEGTEFIGVNPQGNPVTFASDTAVTIPPSSTSDQGAQVIITRGQAEIPVTARAPGSGSNIEAGTINQIVPPGQAPISPGGGALLLQHGPITGGSEEMVYIVKDTDVQDALSRAIPGLGNRARQTLEQQANANTGLSLEVTTITLDPTNAPEDQGYTVTVIPPVGQPVADPENPTFQVAVAGEFSALATPVGSSLQEQLQRVLPALLASEDRLPRGMGVAFDPDNWQWDGSMLTVDGMLEPTGEVLALDAETRMAILNAIRGHTRSEAQAALDAFVAQGVISDYAIPEGVDRIPNWVQLSPVQTAVRQ
jgi:hypothetical protein